jgi:bifunctional DNA-binding transcriptional regulator/antitoxin component of YhaV-PrlF toxin-antitoxin module
MKTTPTEERVVRVGQRRQVVIPREILETLKLQIGDLVAFAKQRNGVLIKPKRAAAAADDVLTAEESALVKKAEHEMRQGKYVTLDQLRHDLDRPRSRGRRKTA